MRTIEDTRLAFRLLRRTPSTTVIAVVSIALSVAATAVAFAAVKAVLITPLPYAHPERLVQIGSDFGSKSIGRYFQSTADFGFWNDAQEIARRTRTLESVAAYGNVIFDLSGDGSIPPEALYGLSVSENLFPALGVKPMLGRNIAPEEDQPGHANEMILSYGLWVRRFNADSKIVGRNVQVDGHDCLVIGVMPPQFNFPLRRNAAHTPSPYVEFWTPIRRLPIHPEGALGIVARLRGSVSLQDAQDDLASINSGLKQEFPATYRDRTLRLALLRDRMLASAAKSLWLVQAATFVFLLIGCANVANLLLARGVARQREIAIRIAVGASKGQILHQLLLESCLLAFLGGIGGYLLAAIAWKALAALAPVSIPRLAGARTDWPVFVFAVAIALFNGVLFGMAPALRAAFTPPCSVRESQATPLSGRHDRLRNFLVIAEVALAITLVVLGTQLTGRFIGLLRTDPGFDAEHIVSSVVAVRAANHEQRGVTYQRFLDAVRAIPGVVSAGTVDAAPFSGEDLPGLIATTDAQAVQTDTQMPAEIDVASSEYLQTMGVRLLQGRWFTARDMSDSSDGAIVSDFAAQRLWPGQSAIGKRICIYCTPEKPDNWKQVIGVVSTMRHRTMDGAPDLNVYLAAGALKKAIFLVVRTNRPVTGLEQSIRRAIASVDPMQPVFLSASMRALISDSIADRRFVMTLLASTAVLALLMAAAGVYGVVSYIASRRTQEIGVRIALGASRGKVHILIFRQGFATVILGVAIGIGLAAALLGILQGIVAGLRSSDALMFAISVGLVSVSAAIACWVPAYRAAKVDPMVALRYE